LGTTPLDLTLDLPSAGLDAPDAGGPRDGKANRLSDYYIIQLADAPLATYAGEVPGLPATRPDLAGLPALDTAAPESVAYLDYLGDRQDRFLTTASRAVGRQLAPAYSYRYALNGVAVRLTPAEAERIAALGGVERVERNTHEPLLTDAGPRWVGAPGIWDGSQTGGLGEAKGEGIVVGLVDTGVNMDHPSFAATGADGYSHTNPLGEGTYVGFCDPDNESYDPKYVCNDKLIGVWSFKDPDDEFDVADPNDDEGHGSHTASTAAGNVIYQLEYPSLTITRTISGVAPHANLITYDACNTEGTCSGVTTVAAIDQAVADGVDVLNYSIGIGRNSPWRNTRYEAFMNARLGGVFVAAAVGNNGPEPSSASGTAPWLLTTGATTHDRWLSTTLTPSGGATTPPPMIGGWGIADSYGPAPIVDATGYENVTGEADDGSCNEPFPPGTFQGEIVVCDSGPDIFDEVERLMKGSHVAAGGAGAMVMANSIEADYIFWDAHMLPAIQVASDDAQDLRSWMATGEGHQAELSGLVINERPDLAGIIIPYSSRGPSTSDECCLRPDSELYFDSHLDVLKPDIIAPGYNVWAAQASVPGSPWTTAEYGVFSGTSMASPHAAGGAALMRQLHPDWSLAQIQSALVSTALPAGLRHTDGSTGAPFDVGAGRLQLGAAARAPLVMDIDDADYAAANPDEGGDPASLNYPSMAQSACLGTCEWTRTVSSTHDKSMTWSVAAGTGGRMELAVDPTEFTLEPGEEQVLQITAEVGNVPFEQWAFGDVRLQPADGNLPGTHYTVAARSMRAELPQPEIVRPMLHKGSHTIAGLRTVSAPELTVTANGLTRAEITGMSLTQDVTPDDPYDPPGGTAVLTGTLEGSMVVLVDVPEGARRLVAEITMSDAPDIDLYVGRDTNRNGKAEETEEHTYSASPLWIEYCDVRDPQAGQWWILVQNWEASAEDATDDVVLAFGIVPAEDQGNMTVTAPESAVRAEPFDVTIDYAIEPSEDWERWYGVLDFGTAVTKPTDLGSISLDFLPMRGPRVYLPVTVRDHPLSVEPTAEPEPTGGPEPTLEPEPTAVPEP
jgi:subtilisin family serine protease